MRREYRSGTGSCLWRWSDVVIGGRLYLRRLHLLKVQLGRLGFAVMLHWIYRPDPQRDLHDHPVAFLALVLRGGYLEQRACGPFFDGENRLWPREVRRFNVLRPTDRHRIVGIYGRKPTVTLCLAGPKTREWGFHTRRGWVHWRDYRCESA